MKKQLITYLALISLFVLAVMVPLAGAYDTYTDCAGCHGSFRAATYSSLAAAKAANPAWPGTSLALHNGHANAPTSTPPGMLNGNCNACHYGASRIPVYTNLSSGTAPFNQSCSGCHDGPGLRAHHVNAGADTCYDCHSDPAPNAENILRPVYTAVFGTTSGTTQVNNSCSPTATGFEGRLKDVASLGLDNDGNLLYDQNDPACAVAAAKISLSPVSLAFGNQSTGSTSATQTVTISNTGTASLSVTGITNSNATDFTVTAPATPLTINAGASQTFTVAFKPATTGAKSANITVSSNAGNPTVNATGTGTLPSMPVLGVSPTTLAFGNQTIGITSTAKAVTISNTGTATLNVTGITSSNAEFAFSPTTVAAIAPGGSTTLNITFKPIAPAGAKSSTISILSNGGNATVSATGTAVAAGALSVTPASLTYASQTVGTASATQTVTMSNAGGTALTVSSITNGNTADFVLTAPVTPLTINAGASQTFTVAFKPATSGAKSATITVASTAGNKTVTASGTGVVAGALSVSPAALTYASQTVGTTSAIQTVTMSNTGGTALTVSSITNGNTADFVLTAPVTPLTINAGASQTFTVAFKPATSGAKSATITVASTAGNKTVTASGTGVVAGALSVSPAALTYASQTVGTTSAIQTVTMSNTGGTALTVSSITNGNTADFVLTAPVTPLTINAGASQTFTVAFKPATSGAKSATITVASTAGNKTVTASGTGVVAGALSVSPAALTYASQTVGSTSATQTVTMSNTGGTALTVSSITNGNTADFVLTAPVTPLTINAGASQTFTVAFKPATSGAKSATITVASTAGNKTVTASGTGVVAGALSVSPAALTYASQTVGTTSAIQTVTMSNTGGTALTVSSITNGNTADFVLTAPVTPLTINAGASQTFTVAFKPATSGAKSATITVASTAGNKTVTASGTGVVAGALSVSPAALTYASQTVGTTSAIQTVTMSNTGGTALTVSSITNGNTADFVLTAPATPLTINAGASQTFTVAFKPATSGAKTETITVASTAGNATVSATGSGVVIVTQPVISVSPTSLTFTDVTVATTASKTVTISNTGNAPLSITGITKAGSAAFSFSPASITSVAAGASATLTVTYSPAVVGADTGTINITSNGGNAAVSLTGNGVQQPSTGTGDAALTMLYVPATITPTDRDFEMKVVSEATTTATGEPKATVTLTATYPDGLKVSIDNSSRTEGLHSNEPKKFEFEADIICNAKGTWPVTWTAKISAAENSNTANDIVTGTTQVTCSGRNIDRESSSRHKDR